MKRELITISILIYWVLLVGWVCPALISYPDTLLVSAGIALFLVSAYGTYRYAYNRYTQLNKETN